MDKRIFTKKRDAVLLFADDNSVFRRTLLKFLKTEYKPAQIIEAKNGVEAFEKTKEYIYDIVKKNLVTELVHVIDTLMITKE